MIKRIFSNLLIEKLKKFSDNYCNCLQNTAIDTKEVQFSIKTYCNYAKLLQLKLDFFSMNQSELNRQFCDFISNNYFGIPVIVVPLLKVNSSIFGFYNSFFGG